MVIMINGAFGVGKTTVARSLRKALPGSLIYNPENVGVLLMLACNWLRISRWRTDDFQNISLWRKSVSVGIDLFRRIAPGPVVSMTFSCRDIFDEVVSDIRDRGLALRVFCLTASLPTLQQRLAKREIDHEREGLWLSRRIKECVEAYRDPHFGESVDAEKRSVQDITEDILNRLGQARFRKSNA